MHEPERRRSRCWSGPCFIIGNAGRHNEAMRDPLKGLCEHGRQPTSALDGPEGCGGYSPRTQRRRKQPASGRLGVRRDASAVEEVRHQGGERRRVDVVGLALQGAALRVGEGGCDRVSRCGQPRGLPAVNH